ncbi:MAG: sugar porter family MFS transporter [Saprospiraceae bacterium]|nr:sugar porter family MFS transporter [Saprospiraceae bacterium]
MKDRRNQIWIAALVSLGGFLFGFDASVISGVTKYIKPEFALSDFELGWVVSSPTFSAMFAMLVAGTISDRVGRKKVLIVVAFLYAISAIWSAMAGGFASLVMARMIGGLAFGAALVLAPIYIAEISLAENRGKMVSIQQLNIVVGFSAAYFSNYYLQGLVGAGGDVTEQTVWRWMLGIEFAPAIIYFIALFFVPRSPRWLLVQNREEEGREVLANLHGKEQMELEYQQIKESIEETKTSTTRKASLGSLLHPSLRFVILIGLTVGILQQITGVNAIYFYATTIFEQSGVGQNAAFAQAVWVGIINVVFTLVAMSLIDRMGRKPLLLIGIFGIAASMFLTSYGFKQATYQLTSDDIFKIEGLEEEQLSGVIGQLYSDDVSFKRAMKKALGEVEFSKLEGNIVKEAIQMNPILILIGILGFVASFAISLGPVMWVMLSELFPNWIRGLAISVIGFINSATSWLVQFIFPWELANLGNAFTYLIYGLFAIVGFVILYRILPETKGKSLEQIEKELVR